MLKSPRPVSPHGHIPATILRSRSSKRTSCRAIIGEALSRNLNRGSVLITRQSRPDLDPNITCHTARKEANKRAAIYAFNTSKSHPTDKHKLPWNDALDALAPTPHAIAEYSSTSSHHPRLISILDFSNATTRNGPPQPSTCSPLSQHRPDSPSN